MKRLLITTILAGFLLSLTPSANAGMIGYGFSSWHKASTEAKVLIGVGAMAAVVGIGYLVYRAYNPTDQEIMSAAQEKINTAQGIINCVPVSDPLDGNGLQRISQLLSDNNMSPADCSRCIQQSMSDLENHKCIIEKRIEDPKRKLSGPTELNTHQIEALIPQLKVRYEIMTTHYPYFNLFMTYNAMRIKYSKALVHKENMPELVLIIDGFEGEQFSFLAYVKALKRDTQRINDDLNKNTQTPASPHGEGAPNYRIIYESLRTALRQLAKELEVIQKTVLNSQKFAIDQKRKDQYDAEQQKLALEKQKAINEENARQEELRIKQQTLELKQQTLKLEQKKFELEQQKANQQQPKK